MVELIDEGQAAKKWCDSSGFVNVRRQSSLNASDSPNHIFYTVKVYIVPEFNNFNIRISYIIVT